jgi:sentrin-specific protease 7
MTRELEPIDSFDELAPAPKPAPHRTARLVSTKGGGFNAPLRDAADHGIMGEAARSGQRSGGVNKGKKRSSHEITDGPDELVEEISGRGVTKPDARIPAEDSPENGPPSLSRRGDLKATKWESKKGANITTSGFAVQAAVCQPNLRYGVGNGQGPCFLQPTPDTELRVFTDDGSKAEPYGWLKVTAKAKTLAYHPESNLIRINQATDQASSATIGALMMLKLCSNAESSRVIRWARDNLSVRVIEEKERYSFRQVLLLFELR